MTETEKLFAANEATWPAASQRRVGGFVVREGRGGGSRVSSATAEPGWSPADIDAAAAAMAEWGQPPLFMIRHGDEALDAALAERGYGIGDRVVFYAAPIEAFGPPPEPMTAFPHWPPLAIAASIWADEGIGPGRLAVMQRAGNTRAAILGRSGDHPVGAAFVAVSGDIAAIHALAVRKEARRAGAGRNILRGAAAWAAAQGASTLMLAVTEGNAPARALYDSHGMVAVEKYHYRVK
ncbi:MAG: GNAT family N-acetyltransferase [Cereibacter sphaeroides]|uniref:GNAT family N-acetyltransferase n=1 Tax=Cereibacter sphaeroides TaxID=1063 RepID=A0A2W5S7S1_CERSP|nr:MAG: GNAT family N-acetyltransferase [Cereibacter sphaeroides]